MSERTRSHISRWSRFASLYIGAGLLGLIVLVSAFAPIATGYGATERVGELLGSPSLSHPFGTDVNSMDVMARTFHAGATTWELRLPVP